jgi:hypothetical protein
MNNVTDIVPLLRQQAELDFRILTEREWESTRRRLITHPDAVLHTARALRRSPDMASVRDVTVFGGSN